MKEVPFTDIHGHAYGYGEFFPPELSYLSYNQTVANDFFPLTKEEVLARGYEWRDPDQKEYQTTLTAADLPDNIADVSDSVLKEIIQCESCKRAYRVITPELNFYKKIGLPCRVNVSTAVCDAGIRSLIVRYSTCVRASAVGESPPMGLSKYRAARPRAQTCGNQFETSYTPDRGEIVYCEQCYQPKWRKPHS